MSNKTNENSSKKMLRIPNEVLQNIAYFRNRYLGGVIKAIYSQFPNVQENIAKELELAIENYKRDKIDSLLTASNIPLVPYHQTLESFQSSCLNQRDFSLFQQLTTLHFIYGESPNITILGPQHFGCEALVSGFGDALCRSFLHTYYIHFEDLLSMLILHRVDAKKNKQYQDLHNKECLIIEDFAGTTIHDRDLLSALYIFLETRVQTHRKSVFEAKQKPNAKVKFRITIITTCRAYEEWIDFFECDKMKAASIATLFYGFGEILYVDVTNKHAIEQGSE